MCESPEIARTSPHSAPQNLRPEVIGFFCFLGGGNDNPYARLLVSGGSIPTDQLKPSCLSLGEAFSGARVWLKFPTQDGGGRSSEHP